MSVEKVTFFALNSMQITINADDFKDAIRQVQFFSDLPSECPFSECRSSLVFNYYKTKPPGNHEFYGVRCTGEVQHSLNFHEHKENKGFYIMAGEAVDSRRWTVFGERNDDPEEQERPAPRQAQKPAQPPPTPPPVQVAAPPPEPTKLAPIVQAIPVTPQLDVMAQGLMAHVNVDPVTRAVTVGVFVITITPGAGVSCDCRRFIDNIKGDVDYKCEHIRAVILFKRAKQAEAAAA